MSSERQDKMAEYMELALRIGAMFLVIYWVVLIVAPFIPAIIWATILAVASYPAYAWLVPRLGGRAGLTATLFTLIALVLLIVPAVWLGQSGAAWGTDVAGRISEGTLKVPEPPPGVAEWPVIGERVFSFWSLAATNLSDAVIAAESQVRAVGQWLLRSAASVAGDVLQFALSIIIAGVMLARAQLGASFAVRLLERLVPGSGAGFVALAEQTIRSVATGVIGVALIQAALVGVGLVVMGIPGAPIWIILMIFVGILQLPATLVTVPILIWVWGSYETLPAVLFTAWIIPAGLSDSVLKPLLLGRGVQTPMLVIFVGAIGGFILSGIVGLFTGAVVVVLAYELFQAWLKETPTEEAATGRGVAAAPDS